MPRMTSSLFLCLLIFTLSSAYADFKLCIDAGAPISGSTISIDADAIAETGAEYVRLNFILGAWDSPDDKTLRSGMTWFECYDKIVDDLLEKNIKIYGLIGGEAVKTEYKLNTDEYNEAYVNNFTKIVEHFRGRIRIFESFNEPNDWAGGTTSQIEPFWFAKMLMQVYASVKIDHRHKNDSTWQLTLISGPLFGHDISEGYGDTGAGYLDEVYKNGIEKLGWDRFRAECGTYPLDGIGYHTYVRQGNETIRSIEDRLNFNINSIYDVISKYEGNETSKKIWISECGWNTAHISESKQAMNLLAAFNLFRNSNKAALGTWFQICDFAGNNKWGIYTKQPYIKSNRKLSWVAFRNFAIKNKQLNINGGKNDF